MFERFSDAARRTVVLAQQESHALAHTEIGPEHLLLGLVAGADPDTTRALAAVGVDLASLDAEVRGEITPGPPPGPTHIPFATPAKQALEMALDEATTMGDGHIGPEHLLLGLVRGGRGVAWRVLDRHGVEVKGLRAAVVAARDDEGGDAGAPAEEPRVVRATTVVRPGAGVGSTLGSHLGGAEACSFCGRDVWELDRFVAAAGARICSACVEAARQILAEATARGIPGDQALRLPPRIFGTAADGAADRVTAALRGALARDLDDGERALHLEHGDACAPALGRATQRYEPAEVVVRALRFLAPDRAQVRFVVVVGRAELPFTGDVVERDGRWTVGRDTVEALLTAAGEPLPPRAG